MTNAVDAVSAASLEICRKVPFVSEREAWRGLLQIAFEPARYAGAKPCRCYHCLTCGDWHLTRRPT